MACVIDWSALGTWITGLAAVALAVIAHRAAAAAGRRADERALRSARALAVSAAIEVHGFMGQAEVVEQHMAALLATQTSATFAGARAVAEHIRPFRLSEWLLTSPSLGDLPENVSVKLTSVAAAAAHADDIIRVARDVLKDEELFHAGGGEAVAQAATSMRKLRIQLEDLMPHLDRVARTHVTADHPRVDGSTGE